MGVTFIAKEGTYTAPAKLTTKSITENGTYSAVDDSANGYSSVTVEVEGGGGSSDFSTATLTLTRGETNDGKFYAPNLMASPLGTSLFPVLNDTVGTHTYEVVVYSGGTVLMYTGTYTVTIDGNIQNLGNGSYLITGDCTITIS